MLVNSQSGDMETVGEEGHRPEPLPDLKTQSEDLWVTVWKAEANWRFDDLLDMATRQRGAE